MFRLCEVEKQAINAKLSEALSPQVGSSVMCFLRRWSRAYLLPDETYYTNVSTDETYYTNVSTNETYYTNASTDETYYTNVSTDETYCKF